MSANPPGEVNSSPTVIQTTVSTSQAAEILCPSRKSRVANVKIKKPKPKIKNRIQTGSKYPVSSFFWKGRSKRKLQAEPKSISKADLKIEKKESEYRIRTNFDPRDGR